jgi:hypothetical protein
MDPVSLTHHLRAGSASDKQFLSATRDSCCHDEHVLFCYGPRWSREMGYFSRVAEPEPKLLAGAGAGAGILKFRLRLPAPAPGQTKVVYLIIIHIE